MPSQNPTQVSLIRRYPSISVILPTYNSSRFILQALDSIYAQTYIPDEVIVADNCSFDNTVQIALERYPSTKLLRHSENIGPYNNWVSGIRKATSDFFILLFSDDTLDADHVRSLLAAQSRSNAHIVIPNPKVHLEAIDSSSINNKTFRKPGKEHLISPPLFINLAILTNIFQISPCGILFKRQNFIESNLSSNSLPVLFSQRYPECLENGAGIDHLLILNSARVSNKVHILDYPTLIFRQHNLSFSTSISRDTLSRLYTHAKILFLNENDYKSLLVAFFFCLRKASLSHFWFSSFNWLLTLKALPAIPTVIYYTILAWSRFHYAVSRLDLFKNPMNMFSRRCQK